ncbi:bifunctional metallophosphatase/5'-nucleotidase [Ktedonospora formicarum]|uniref:Multifunctional 2',3'-cyclic-nucleotide 2'-phosphodiesterase/5'-nucleotidase/3'-nucleotidase n=1 Tax=Ktedonospora formicarum TaxID=2778364 RepID=A0A8J3MUP2_9CHLR|nr:bifunctional UDP-sugar hydrolase/5'-nucleotidase [Ktedonospora formicarum]GHO46813.1 multifunctional 2',3'-cyclic-nucleotide 2'-phosphodiesterase/5'-nucleotidase/3'-nucleotidase [Ktedonospora formicarum]
MAATPQRIRILHSNDIHGRIAGLARIATLVKREREEHPELPILYLDGGDIEESSVRLSNLTRGVGMHRLLAVAGCDAATIGNGGMMRYGYQILKEYGEAVHFPELLANMRTPEGAVPEGALPATILQAGSLRLGIIGLTDNLNNIYTEFFSMPELPAGPLVRELTTELHQQGAEVVIVLSHLGLPNDRNLALELQGIVPLIIGAHTHDLLPEGEQIGEVLIAQAGYFAQHLGQIDLFWDGSNLHVEQIQVRTVEEEVPPAPEIQIEVERVEAEMEHHLNMIVGIMDKPFDYSEEHECAAANLMADMLRERMSADIGMVTAGISFIAGIPAGPLTRKMLWEICPWPSNPAIVEMTGEQLLATVRRGYNPQKAAERPRPLRGHALGFFHLSGASYHDGELLIAGAPVEAERIYRIASTDNELNASSNYIDSTWGLKPHYDVPVILREAMEEYIGKHGHVSPRQ